MTENRNNSIPTIGLDLIFSEVGCDGCDLNTSLFYQALQSTPEKSPLNLQVTFCVKPFSSTKLPLYF